jgi:hypothetical protein
MCAICGRESLRRDPEEALGPATAFRRWVAYVGMNQAFFLEPGQRSVNGSYRNFAAGAKFDFLSHGDSVRSFGQAQNRQNNNVFKISKVLRVGHYIYNMEEMTGCQYVPWI